MGKKKKVNGKWLNGTLGNMWVKRTGLEIKRYYGSKGFGTV